MAVPSPVGDVKIVSSVSTFVLNTLPMIIVDNRSLFHRLEEVTAQANKFSRLIEQREEQVRSLKTRLEEAVHQNNKLTNAAELKDDRIKTLEQR